jgi:hypothetical protein
MERDKNTGAVDAFFVFWSSDALDQPVPRNASSRGNSPPRFLVSLELLECGLASSGTGGGWRMVHFISSASLAETRWGDTPGAGAGREGSSLSSGWRSVSKSLVIPQRNTREQKSIIAMGSLFFLYMLNTERLFGADAGIRRKRNPI